MHSVTWNDDLLARVVLDPVLLSDLFCCEDRLGCKVLSIVRGCSLCCWRAVIATQPASIWISLFCWQAAKRPWVLYVTSATNQAGIANERLSTRLNCVACILTLFKQRFLRYRVKRVAGQESCAQFMHREFIERVQRTTVNVLTLRKRRNAPRSCYYIYIDALQRLSLCKEHSYDITFESHSTICASVKFDVFAIQSLTRYDNKKKAQRFIGVFKRQTGFWIFQMKRKLQSLRFSNRALHNEIHKRRKALNIFVTY